MAVSKFVDITLQSMLAHIFDRNTKYYSTRIQSNRGLGPWPYGGEKRVEEDARLFLPEPVRNTTKPMDFKQVPRVAAGS